MKFHSSVIDKLMTLVASLGGHDNESKLRVAISRLDLTPYERKTTKNQEVVLVLTEDFLKKASGR